MGAWPRTSDEPTWLGVGGHFKTDAQPSRSLRLCWTCSKLIERWTNGRVAKAHCGRFP
jgi:hypothetical protein